VVKDINWLKPPRGQLKLSIDASYVTNGIESTGAVLRNAKGDVLVGMACPLDNILSAATAEAYALLKGLKILDKIGCSSCIVESYSLELAQACIGKVEINDLYSVILADCFQMASVMTKISWFYIVRGRLIKWLMN
jgi:hypothetical protein